MRKGKERSPVKFKYNCMKEYDYIWRESVFQVLKMVIDYVRGKGSHLFKKIYIYIH